MSSLSTLERRDLEKYLGMSGGYVMDFSDRTFGEYVLEAVGLDIHSQRYTTVGHSKAKKLRAFWEVEPDHVVGRLLIAFADYGTRVPFGQGVDQKPLEDRCRQIA